MVIFSLIGKILIILLIATPATFLLGLLLRRLNRLPTPADQFHFAPTTDGWNIALYRYMPDGSRPLASGAPVILCHGMMSNRFNVDLDEEHSLARHLRDAGFDSWVMEMRGHGGSRRIANGGIGPFDWTIDDYVMSDLPAVIEYVKRISGSPEVHWVGHSLGGMILYAACARGLTGSIRSAVMSDVPADFSTVRTRKIIAAFYSRHIPVVPPFLFIPFVLVLGLISPSLFLPKYGIHNRRTMLRLVANGIIDLGSSSVANHLVTILKRGRFISADGKVDYEAGIERIHFPILQMGATQWRCPDVVTRKLIDLAPVRDKEYIRLGRSEGFSEDYNHFTILVGERVREEIFPIVARFLRKHSSPAGGIEDAE